MQINERQEGDVCIIGLAITPAMRGKYEGLQEIVRERLAAGIKKIVINLSACEWIDSAALGELIKVQVSAMRQEGRVRLSAVPPKVKALLDVTNLSQVFVICDDDAAAMVDLAQ